MRTIPSRAAALAAVLLVALPVAASADVSEYAAEASTTAVGLSAFESQVGSPVLELVGTDAFGSSDPMASASVDAIEVLGTTVGEVRTASSERERDRDPESGDGCTVPVEATGLTLEAVCAVATARAGNPGDTGNQDAAGTTRLTNVAVDGSLVAGALETPLGDAVATAGDLLVEGATAEFLEECNELIATIDDQAQVTQTAGDLLAMAPDELDPIAQGVSDVVEDADEEGFCAAVFNLTAGELSEEVLDVSGVLDALAGRDLLTITIDGASSAVDGTDTSIAADAQQVFVSITGPSLDFLDDVIQSLVDAIVDEVELIAGGGTDPLPLPDDFDLGPALDAIPLFGITDPLLTAVVSGGSASAELALGDGATSGGGDQPYVTVSIAPGVVELLGGDPEMASVNLAAGESQTIAADTPAESTVSVGTLTVDDDATFEDTDLTGSQATASVTEVALLTGVEGGVTLVLSESSAGVFATMASSGAPADPDDDPLPHTGGGAAAVAALALGAAVLLRRRRD